MRAQLEPVSSNGGRKIAVFEAQNFDEGRLIIFLFLGKSTLQSPVSYSVTKTFRKKNVKFRRSGTLRGSPFCKVIESVSRKDSSKRGNSSRYKLNNIGERIHPCRTSLLQSKKELLLLPFSFDSAFSR